MSFCSSCSDSFHSVLFRSAERHSVLYCYAECPSAKCNSVASHSVPCLSVICLSVECRSAKCRGAVLTTT